MTHSCMNFDGADPAVQHLGLGAAALRYQDRDYAVLPLVRGGKKPHRMLPWSPEQPSGVHHGTLDYGSTMAWWADDPAANVGVATGSKSRLAVIDLDVKRGQDGPAEFESFTEAWSLPMPLLPACVRTPSGGYHIWLRTPAGVVVPERPGILPGVDVKGDGGLVVAPPSMILTPTSWRPGEPRDGSEAPIPYTWAAGCPCSVPDTPSWLLPWLETAPASGSPGASTGAGENADSPDLGSLKATGIPRGERNATMYRLACRLLRERGTDAAASLSVKEDLMQVWQKGDRTGFSASELLTLIDSARRFVQGEVEKDRTQFKGAIEGLTGWANREGR